jgi:hypothetical protein
MKNYIIGFLVICLLVLVSFVYKHSKKPVLEEFPIENRPAENTSNEPPLYLFIFFSQHNCHVCMEAIQVLNELQPPFFVTGVVPGEELKNEAELRTNTGAAFHLIRFNDILA